MKKLFVVFAIIAAGAFFTAHNFQQKVADNVPPNAPVIADNVPPNGTAGTPPTAPSIVTSLLS